MRKFHQCYLNAKNIAKGLALKEEYFADDNPASEHKHNIYKSSLL